MADPPVLLVIRFCCWRQRPAANMSFTSGDPTQRVDAKRLIELSRAQRCRGQAAARTPRRSPRAIRIDDEDTRIESVLAANGGNTMVRKVIIALAAVAFVGAVAASTTADARMGGMGGGFHGGGFHGGGFHGGGFHAAGIGCGFRGGMVGGGFRGAAFRGGVVGGGFRSATFRHAVVGGGFRSAAFRHGFVGSRSFAFRPGLRRAPIGLRSPGSIGSTTAASSPLPRRRSSPALASMAPRAGAGSRHRGDGSGFGPVTITATTEMS